MLYCVCIFKNCTHSCPSIFIIISIILINTLIPVVQAGKDVSYFGIILIGFAITGKFLTAALKHGIRNPETETESRKRKRNHGNGNGNGYGICERRFQAIDLKKNILAMTIK